MIRSKDCGILIYGFMLKCVSWKDNLMVIIAGDYLEKDKFGGLYEKHRQAPEK
jgi:hypothetical protein